MRHGKLLFITVVVIGTGGLAALPYQRAPVDGVAPTANNSPETLPLRSSEAPTPELVTLSLSPTDAPGLPNQSPAAGFLSHTKQKVEEPVLTIPQVRREMSIQPDASAPEIAQSFRPFTETIRLLRDAESKRLARTAEDDSENRSDNLVPIEGAPTDEEPEAEQPLRRHRIVDGDTLSRLADRFYDDPALSEVIFQANRELLRNPDVLPLGTELVIPPKPAGGSSPTTILGVPRTSEGPLETISLRDDNLVPIE